jgi:tRNA pseudouridine32 synthase/23S rRNA pseudouridine746 synthase
MRDGVGASCVSLPSGHWPLLLEFLAEKMPNVSRQAWLTRMQTGLVFDEQGECLDASAAYRAHTRVYYFRELATEPRIPVEESVLYQDEHLVVADKPHFLPVTPSGGHLHETLLVRLKRKLGIDTLTPVHRIDRETAGLVLFSIDPSTRGRYQRVFAERLARKEYECIAPWRAALALPLTQRSRLVDDPAHFMRMCEAPGEPNSETRIALIERSGPLARYRLLPLTGKRHQLRVHCAALGMPIVGDRIYPSLLPANTDDHARPLQLLARVLAFTDPVTGEARRFESTLRLRPMTEDADHQ